MSYGKFLDELEDISKPGNENDILQDHYPKNFRDLRDAWIKNGRYSELTSFINENWDSGNGEEFFRPYSEHLIEKKELGHFKKLWKGILRHRIANLWRDFDFVKAQYPSTTLEEIKSQNLENFDPSSFSESRIRSLSWRREYTLKGIEEYIDGLKKLEDQTEFEKTERLYNNISNLTKLKAKVSADKRKINEDLFWQLIEESRIISEDKYDFIACLSSKLEGFKPAEIRKYHRVFRSKCEELNQAKLWALAFIVRRGCGDDAFDYFKAWVISKGQNAFNAISALNINEIQQYFDEDPQLEQMLFLAESVYENKTGDFMTPVRVKKNKLNQLSWTEETLATDFPELCDLFNYRR